MVKPRNFDRVTFEDIRIDLDPPFNAVHDELSECFYGKKPFRGYGILDKETFDKLHGMIFMKRDCEFHKRNLARLVPYPESRYNEMIKDGKKIDLDVHNKNRIQELQAEGIDIDIVV